MAVEMVRSRLGWVRVPRKGMEKRPSAECMARSAAAACSPVLTAHRL